MIMGRGLLGVGLRVGLGLGLGLMIGCAGASRSAASPEDQACEQAGDCVITRLPLGACCEGCAPRALNEAAAATEVERCGHYAKDCPIQSCDDDGAFADCVRGRCVVKR